MPTRSGFSTRERIVHSSIELFNEFGVLNVSTNEVAKRLGISPGNLTYHFKRKKDLLRATFGVFESRLRQALEIPSEHPSAIATAEHSLNVLTTIWGLRFFFNAMIYVFPEDEGLRRDYLRLRAWVLRQLEHQLQLLVKSGVLRVPNPLNSTKMLASNMWSVWTGWLRMAQNDGTEATVPSDSCLLRGAIQHWSLCQPWLDETFATELLDAYSAVLRVRARQRKKSARDGGSARNSVTRSSAKSLRDASRA